MPAGTIKLTNNSTAVTGTGTSFTTELKPNDFLVAVVGGVTYTLGVDSVTSNTALVLKTAYNGPAASGQAWTPIPNGALVGITAQVAADVAKAIRGLNMDKANWQQVFSGSGNITVNLPDGSQYTGQAWNSLSTALADKANTSDLGNAAGRNVGTTSGTVAAGNDGRLDTINGKTGGTLTGGSGVNIPAGASFYIGSLSSSADNSMYIVNTPVNVTTGQYVNWTHHSWFEGFVRTGIRRGSSTNVSSYSISMAVNDGSGTTRSWEFNANGTATGQGSWVTGSDIRHKTNIKVVDNALASVLSSRGVIYDKKDGEREVGMIAQEVEKFCPDAIIINGDMSFSDGTVVPDFKYLNTAGATAAYHTEAIKALFSLVELALTEPETALKHLDEIRQKSLEIAEIEIKDKDVYQDNSSNNIDPAE